MKKKLSILAGLLFICLIPLSIQAQGDEQDSEPQSIDQYIEQARSIVIVRCLNVGPVKANLEGDLTVQILQTLKGAEKPREIVIVSRYAMQKGGLYLLRLESEPNPAGDHYHIKSFLSAVPLSPYEDLERLKTLPLRIQVLRIFNGRKDDVDSEMRRLRYEQEALERVLKNQ